MSVHVKAKEMQRRLSPENLGLVYCSAKRIELEGKTEINSETEELCLVCIEGISNYFFEGETGTAVLSDMLYVPIQSKITLEGKGVFICFGAICSTKYSFRHIPFAQVNQDNRHKIYGKAENGTLRDVWNFIDEDFPSGRFLTGICKGRDGGWTAWPPHEHGAEREEVYVYYNMGNSFGVQCVYEDLQQAAAYAVTEGDLVAIPKGYHPNCGCPGGGIHYVYCMVSTEEGVRDFMTLRTQTIYGDKLE